LAAAWVTRAGASLFLGQVLVARGETGKLTLAWVIGLVAAAAGLLLASGEPDFRIGVAFLAGEGAAVFTLAAMAARFSSPIVYTTLKRTLDIVIGTALLLVLLPAMGAVVIAVKLNSRGPVFFHQTRVGLNGKQFAMLKFRTMQHNADETVHLEHLEQLRDQPQRNRLKMDNDPRVTPIGRLLRKGSLDELPNLWNVIRGEMSLVGPRPLVPAESELLGDPTRRIVKPGITGLAQVHGRDAISPEQRNRYDTEYVRSRTLLLDLKILAATIPAIIRDPGE
ncbi:MAG TPA: sugar transferase, partial [Actinobacteria bacterium]|nr:sugar transferase [Actinomycetota bacterium]